MTLFLNTDYDVLTAEGMDDARSYLTTHAPDVVLVSVGVQPMGGHALCRTIKVLYGEDVAVVLMTDPLAAWHKTDAHAQACAVDGWLMTPFNKDGLHQAVEQAWRRGCERRATTLRAVIDESMPDVPNVPRARL